MKCSKCGNGEMYREDDRKADMVVHVCFKCGNRIYKDYPRKHNRVVRLIEWKMRRDVFCDQ